MTQLRSCLLVFFSGFRRVSAKNVVVLKIETMDRASRIWGAISKRNISGSSARGAPQQRFSERRFSWSSGNPFEGYAYHGCDALETVMDGDGARWGRCRWLSIPCRQGTASISSLLSSAVLSVSLAYTAYTVFTALWWFHHVHSFFAAVLRSGCGPHIL